MAYSITNLINDMQGAMHGTTINQVTNLYGIFNRAARDVVQAIDAQETKRIVLTGSPIFNGVWDYPIPPDLKGNKVIDLRPQWLRLPGDKWLQDYNQQFDMLKNNSGQPDFTINFNTSIKSLRINSPNLISGVTLNQVDGITSNGTWAVGGGASNLRVDNQNFVTGAASLAFDLAAGPTTAYLENSTMGTNNIASQINQATLFLYTYFPVASGITSVELRWGSSSSDYYAVTTTQTQQSTVFQNAWDLLSFNWYGATVVGAPNPANITYLRVTWNYDGVAQTAVRLDAIQSIVGRFLELEYYSKFLFRNSITGAYQETVTSDSDLVNLDTDSYNIFYNRVMYLAAQQVQGIDMTFGDGPFFEKEYLQGVQRYKAMYKSEVQKPRTNYYVPSGPGYDQYFGTWRSF